MKMKMEFLIQNININNYSVLLLVISFTITYLMIPKLIAVIRYKNLMDNPNSRSSHVDKTPSLGGIAFYVSIIFCLFLIQWYDFVGISFNIIAALTILFIAGLKDDLVILSVKAKIFSQFLAVTLLLINAGIPIENFYGYLGLAEVPFWLNIGFCYFAMLSIINAYNLIDGIDGLAGMMGILIFAVFGVVFYILYLHFYFLLALVPLGYLIAFLRYNVSKNRKIFMGDTGSMITGFLIGVLALRFLSLEEVQLQTLHIQPENVLLLTLGILFILTTDTLRVVMIRLWHKKGLFKPDKNHVHHILIDTGLSHGATSFILTGYSIFMITLFYIINLYLPMLSLLLVISIAMFFTMAVLFHLKIKYRSQKLKPNIKIISTLKKPILKIKLKRVFLQIFEIFF